MVSLHQSLSAKRLSSLHFNSKDVLWTKMSKPRIRPKMLDSWKDAERIIKASLAFLKSSELSWLEGIMVKVLWHRENSKTYCQEKILGLQSLLICIHRWKNSGAIACLPIEKTWITTRSLSLSLASLHKSQLRRTELISDVVIQITQSPRLSNQGSVVNLKFWSSLCCGLDIRQSTIRCLSSSVNTNWCTPASWFHDSIVSNWDSVLTSKFWSPRYRFWARL